MILESLLVMCLATTVVAFLELQSNSCLYKLPMATKYDPEDCTGYFALFSDHYIQEYCPPGAKYSVSLSCCVTGRCPPCNCENLEPTTPPDFTTSWKDCNSSESSTTGSTITTKTPVSDITYKSTGTTAQGTSVKDTTETTENITASEIPWTTFNSKEESMDTSPVIMDTTSMENTAEESTLATTDETTIGETIGITDTTAEVESTSITGEESSESSSRNEHSTTSSTSNETTVVMPGSKDTTTEQTETEESPIVTANETTTKATHVTTESTTEVENSSVATEMSSEAETGEEPVTTSKPTDGTTTGNPNGTDTTTQRTETEESTSTRVTAIETTTEVTHFTTDTTSTTTKLSTDTTSSLLPTIIPETTKGTTTTPNQACATLPTGTFLPDPDHCSRYYVCTWGEAVLMHCPYPLWFDTKLNVCNWRKNVICAANKD